ncbi:hypothetical protein Hanom_Chr04g00323181 [Helianthus anomalus]
MGAQIKVMFVLTPSVSAIAGVVGGEFRQFGRQWDEGEPSFERFEVGKTGSVKR